MVPEDTDAADDIDALDSMQFTDDDVSVEEDELLFIDAVTWSEDDDEHLTGAN